MTRPISVTTRLVSLFALMSASVLLGLGWAVSAAIERHFIEQDQDVLEGKIQLVRQIVGKVRDEGDLAQIQVHLADAFVGHHDLSMAVFNTRGDTLFATTTLDFPREPVLQVDPRARPTPFEWHGGHGHYRGLAAQARTEAMEAPPLIIAVAIDIGHHGAFIDTFRHTLVLFVLGAVLLSGLLGWWVVRRGLAPLHLLKNRAAAVTASRLDQRLPVEAIPVELADLATELNAMLCRLEDAFARLSQFSSDLAHELRTPISNLMTQTQVALSQARDAATYRDILASNSEEYERLSRMISDMLFLAKADHGLALPSKEPVALEREVSDLFEFFEALAEDRGVTLAQSGSAIILGDRLMLRRALSNLLSNALRYTPRGGTVEVAIEQHGEAVTLTVQNPGRPIPEGELRHLFDRFYRADPAREHAQASGAGLGLAITRAILTAHRGSIEARSQDGKTSFILRFPAPG